MEGGREEACAERLSRIQGRHYVMRSAGTAPGVPDGVAVSSPHAAMAAPPQHARVSPLQHGAYPPPSTRHHGSPRANNSSPQHLLRHSTAPRATSALAPAPASSVPPGYGPANATLPLTQSPSSFPAHQGSALAHNRPVTSPPATVAPAYFTSSGAQARHGCPTVAVSTPSARPPFALITCGPGGGVPPEEASAGVEGALVGLKRACSDPVSAVRSHLPPRHTHSEDVPCNGCSGGRCFSHIPILGHGAMTLLGTLNAYPFA